MTVLVISGLDDDPNGRVFTSDRGTWNVTRALADCAAGKHKLFAIDVAEAVAANVNVEVDWERVVAFLRSPAVLRVPLLAVIEDGMLWIIDGHHRLRALHRLGIKKCAAYVIDEKEGARYRVLFDGRRAM